MAYKHGVYVSEVPTSIIPAVNTTAGLPVVFGTAPIHLAKDRAMANKPILCHSYEEAVSQLGYSDDWDTYTLCEVMTSQFALYNRGPVVFVNVLDPEKFKKTEASKEVHITDKVAKIEAPVLLESLNVKKLSAGESLKAGVDYEASYDAEGVLNITVLEGGQVHEASSLFVDYNALDPSKVNAEAVIGGIDIASGKSTGLECLNKVFSLTGLVPGLILAPGYSDDPKVAAVMTAKATNINGHFTAMVLLDVPASTVTKYTDVKKWKDDNNYTAPNQVVCWPMVKLGDDIYHMSTHALGVLAQTDSKNGDIPYESPSNKSMQCNGICLADGKEVILGTDEAEYLNGQGIVTAINFIGGWKLFGNRTACYPANTDPKDCFISIRRMFMWHAQTFIQTYWQKLDQPINKRLIQTVVDSENIRLNGLKAQGAILGGRVEFYEDENPVTNLIDGIVKFHTYITPPAPAREIDNVLEYDPSYFSSLFK